MSNPIMPPTWQAQRLLTVQDVAAWARVHPKSVYRWIKTGQMNAIQLGPRTYRIPAKAVEAFLEKTGYQHLAPPPELLEVQGGVT